MFWGFYYNHRHVFGRVWGFFVAFHDQHHVTDGLLHYTILVIGQHTTDTPKTQTAIT